MKAADLVSKARAKMTQLAGEAAAKARPIQVKGKRTLRQMGSELKKAPAHSKIGLGLGTTSLTLGLANYQNNKTNMKGHQTQQEIEAQSLSVLNKIHRAIASNGTKAAGQT